MKTIIYIRHGSDKETKYRHDQKLTHEGKKETALLCERLIKEHGLPNIIYCSPLYRTRQTARIIKKKILKYHPSAHIKIEIEPRLGRFFTKRERNNPDVHISTLSKNVIIDETWYEFLERVDKQYSDITSSKHLVIWNITHSLVFLRVSKLTDIPHSLHVQYSDFLTIKK